MNNFFLSFFMCLFLGITATTAWAAETPLPEPAEDIEPGHFLVVQKPESDVADPASSSDVPQEWHSQVVTSIQDCYDQLDPSEMLEIQKNYTKPYQECQARLARHLKEKKLNKDKDIAEKKTPVAETPRNYLRIQPEKTAPEETPADLPDAEKSEKPAVDLNK